MHQQGLVDDFRTFGWVQLIKYPEEVYQRSGNYLANYIVDR